MEGKFGTKGAFGMTVAMGLPDYHDCMPKDLNVAMKWRFVVTLINGYFVFRWPVVDF